MAQKFEKALADWPQTKLIEEHGNGMHITGRYFQPGLEKKMQTSWGFITFGIAGFVLIATANIIAVLFIVAIMAVMYFLLWKPAMAGMLAKHLNIKIFGDRIELRQGGWGYKKYSRDMDIEFKIEQHHKALEEYQREQRYGRKMADTYRQAIEVVMQYGEKRVVLCELPNTEIEKAKALVLRIHRMASTLDVAQEVARKIEPIREGDFGPAPEMR